MPKPHTLKPAIKPAIKPLRLAAGQKITAKVPGRNCKVPIKAAKPRVVR